MSEESREHRPFAAEVKFLLAPSEADAVRAWARGRLPPDPHGAGEDADYYCITSLYADTAAQDVFFRRGSFGRSKYRIRRYADSDMVFLERKLRTKNLLTKRRTLVPIGDLAFIESGPESWPDGWPGTWFGHRLATRRLAPVCQVDYDRVARLAHTPYGFARLTMDENLQAWPTSRREFQDGASQPVLAGKVILELKYRVGMPAVFKALVEEFGLQPAPVSKYRLSMAALGLASDPASEESTACRAS